MATIDLAVEGATGTHPSRASNVKVPYLIEVTVDWADAATAKGSALAAADVIQAIPVPAETVVLFAGFEVLVAETGGSADVAITLGDGVDPNRWVDTFDLDAAVAGDYGTLVVATSNPTVFAAADTIDVTISAATTAPTAGSIRVFAMLVDAVNKKAPGIVALGS